MFEAPVIINPLPVSVQKSGEKRLILDLRHVNQFFYKCRFRCEDLSIETKCVWEPTQVITWLGAVLNTSTSEVSATAKRITSLQEDLATLLAIPSSCHSVRKLASVSGKIISLGPCVGNVSRLMSRNLFAVINTAQTWNSYARLSSEALSFSGSLMRQVLTAYLFGLSGISLRRSSIPMLLAQLAAVPSSSKGRCSIKPGQILRKLKVLHSESC